MFKSVFILASYFLISCAPMIAYFSGKNPESLAWVVGAALVAWGIIWVAFKRPAHFHWLLLPAFVLLPADIYLYLFYDRGISARHIGMLLDTSTWEMTEFFGAEFWWVILLAIAGLIWWWSIRLATLHNTTLDCVGTSRKLVLILIAMASLWGNSDVEWSDTRPFGLYAVAVEYIKERQQLAHLLENNHGFQFGAHQAHLNQKPLVVVMVIGESSRADRWSLNGYERETNPLLSLEPNLLNAPDMIASASATLFSLPVMLSRKGTLQTFKTGFAEKSLITAFKEAGFRTYWLSNQIPFGKFDTPVSVFAKEADVLQFMNLGSYSETSSLDEILLSPLENALKEPSPKKLIILHTLGNHWNYSRRYSKQFDRWHPSLFDMPNPDHTDASLKERINNSYDNSVLYADWFLSRVIAALKSSGLISAMMFVSDHGENLHDGACDFVLHGHNSQYDYHVPMLIWYSQQYAAAYPQKIVQIKQHIKSKLAAENIFHSLLDIADIRYHHDRLEWSFASKQFKLHKRYVDSYGWADYDHSTFQGDCREVIDKGTPLLRDAGHI